ncbi:hypothetical protein K458DRAFT_382411 [Lentithecium fluviatile CBS 122367]|uniref:BTB domain-containing protein n=1 Tax=Lentithecium fluviatile CBS 122367 TaxID=1168545 RepID=A0A6G1JJU4_9PLEO|nr:hypothetical protein K458DRAFT_382411 [Lentithecium fluviatile CBS 122367]
MTPLTSVLTKPVLSYTSKTCQYSARKLAFAVLKNYQKRQAIGGVRLGVTKFDLLGPADNIIVKIGERGVEHHVSKIPLARHSEYFKIEDAKPFFFELFIDWLYWNEIPSVEKSSEDISATLFISLNWVYSMARLMLYAFADRFLVPKLKRDLNRALATDYCCLSMYLGLDVIDFAFKNLPDGDTIRDLLVDMYCSQWSQSAYDIMIQYN